MEQPTLEDAWREAQAGIEQSDKATHESWKIDTDIFIQRYLQTHPEMFVDDLWAAGLVEPPSPRALGARIRHAVAQGWMRRSDRSRPSVRSRGGHKPIWISLIYDREVA